jgi:hypothetical protein
VSMLLHHREVQKSVIVLGILSHHHEVQKSMVILGTL